METAAQGGGFNSLFMIFLVIMIGWLFFSTKGQKKREAERMSQINALQKGDEVIIAGGIIGTVAGFKDNALEVKIADNVKLTVLKNSVIGFVNNKAVAPQGGSK